MGKGSGTCVRPGLKLERTAVSSMAGDSGVVDPSVVEGVLMGLCDPEYHGEDLHSRLARLGIEEERADAVLDALARSDLIEKRMVITTVDGETQEETEYRLNLRRTVDGILGAPQPDGPTMQLSVRNLAFGLHYGRHPDQARLIDVLTETSLLSADDLVDRSGLSGDRARAALDELLRVGGIQLSRYGDGRYSLTRMGHFMARARDLRPPVVIEGPPLWTRPRPEPESPTPAIETRIFSAFQPPFNSDKLVDESGLRLSPTGVSGVKKSRLPRLLDAMVEEGSLSRHETHASRPGEDELVLEYREYRLTGAGMERAVRASVDELELHERMVLGFYESASTPKNLTQRDIAKLADIPFSVVNRSIRSLVAHGMVENLAERPHGWKKLVDYQLTPRGAAALRLLSR